MIGTLAEHIAARRAINKLRFFEIASLRSDIAHYRTQLEGTTTVLGYAYFEKQIASAQAQIATVHALMEDTK